MILLSRTCEVMSHFRALDQLYGSSGSSGSQSTMYGASEVPLPAYVRLGDDVGWRSPQEANFSASSGYRG